MLVDNTTQFVAHYRLRIRLAVQKGYVKADGLMERALFRAWGRSIQVHPIDLSEFTAISTKEWGPSGTGCTEKSVMVPPGVRKVGNETEPVGGDTLSRKPAVRRPALPSYRGPEGPGRRGRRSYVVEPGIDSCRWLT